MMKPIRKPLLYTRHLGVCYFSIAIMVVFLVLLWARAYYGSMKAFQEAEQYLRTGHTIRAITFFDRCLHWYTPFNPYVRNSIESLWEISQRAENTGDIRLALIAVRTIRQGLIAARGFYIPETQWIARCERRIHKLLLQNSRPNGDEKALDTKVPSILDDPQVRGPDVFWTTVSLGGLIGWIGSALILIIRVPADLTHSGRIRLSNIGWFLFLVISWAVWFTGMTQA